MALVVAGGLAAALSTASGLLLVIASSFSHDIYKEFLKKDATEGEELLVARGCMLLARTRPAASTSAATPGRGAYSATISSSTIAARSPSGRAGAARRSSSRATRPPSTSHLVEGGLAEDCAGLSDCMMGRAMELRTPSFPQFGW
jgi:hypothetical protein